MNSRVKYWLELAEYDIETAEAMLETKRFLYVGFMCHQAIEKMLKACFVNIHGQQPPRIHNLRLLADKCRVLSRLDKEQRKFLISLEPLNIEARYPTDKEKLFKSLTHARCGDILNASKEFVLWIKNQL